MKKFLLLWVSISLFCFSVSAFSHAEATDLPTGTLIKLTLCNDVTDQVLKNMSRIDCEIIEDIEIDGEVIFPKGTHVYFPIDEKKHKIIFDKLEVGGNLIDIKIAPFYGAIKKVKKDGKKQTLYFKAGTNIFAQTY